MKVGIDASSYARPLRTGVARYIGSLVNSIAALDHESHYYLFHRFSRLKHRDHFLRVNRPTFHTRLLLGPLSWPVLKGLDVFHGLDARLPRFCRGTKKVVTFHDLSVFVSDEFSPESFRLKKRARYAELATEADHFIAVSESTRRALLEFLGADETRITVVHEGVTADFFPRPPEEQEATRKKYHLDKDFVLFVGAISRRKNVATLLRAFAVVAEKTGLDLVLVGRPGFGHEAEMAPLGELGIGERVHTLGFVPDADLPALYSAASVFVFPSLYEGFGIPLLEAMACGTPIVASDTSSIPEVVGEAGILVPPTDHEQLAEAIIRVVEDRALSKRLSEAGLERAKQFTWERAARQTLGVYRRLAAR